MSKRLIMLKLFLGIIVFGLYIFAAPLSNVYERIAGALASVLFIFVDQIQDLIINIKTHYRNKNILKSYLLDLSKFTNTKLNIKLDQERLMTKSKQVLSNFSGHREDAYRLFLDQSKLSVDKDIVFILSLAHQIDVEKDDIEKSRYKDKISKTLENLDNEPLGTRTKTLLDKYADIHSIKDYNHESLILDFSKRYCTTHFLGISIFNDLKQAEEFRRTLSILITQGKINLSLLHKDLKSHIQSILKEQRISKGFIILMNKYQKIDSVKASLDKFPQVEMGRIKPHNFPDSAKYLHMRIVYPEQQYSSTNEFLTKEILEKVPKDELGNGFAVVLPLEILEIMSYPQSIDDIKQDNVRTSFEAVNFFKTGLNKDVIDIISEYTLSETKLSDLLSIIPFNIFVPQLKIEAKNFLIDKYDDIRKEFNIKSVFDWAHINPESLAEKIINLDTRKTKTDKEWRKISKKICEEAKKHNKALQ